MNSDLSLAAMRGWKIFPLLHSSRFAVSQPLPHDATSNVAQIEHWENKYPECNWAVAIGEESGVFAIKPSLLSAFVFAVTLILLARMKPPLTYRTLSDMPRVPTRENCE
jgi:hypothetical protein